MGIDINGLKNELKQDSYGAFFWGGFGGAIFEVASVDKASPEKVVKMAKDKGIDISKYEKWYVIKRRKNGISGTMWYISKNK